MALDLSMKSRKRSHRDSESSSSTSTIRTVDEADNLRTDGVLDLSIPGASKKRTLSQSSGCSDYSDTGSVTRRLERTRLQSRTPPTVPAQRVTRQGMCRLYLLLRPLVFYGQNLKKEFFGEHKSFFTVRPLILLFWTSGGVSSGFQSQSGQPYSRLAEAYM